MKISTAIFAGVLGLVAASAGAQEVRRALPASENPEVRRAEPVDPSTYQNPAWMERVRPAEAARPVPTPSTPAPEVRPAVPIPVSTPIPLEPEPTPEPTPQPTPAPALEPATAGPEPTPEPESSADPLPGATPAPAENVPGMNRSLVAANGFYRRKIYDMAVYEYEKFLIAEPHASGRDGALFRLGESHRFLGNEQAARDAYQRLLNETGEGEFAGSAAYRLGEIFFAEGNYAAAADLFAKAEANASSPEVKLSALFYQANALDKSNRRADAAKTFGELAKAEGDNPYRDTALFYLAEESARTGRKPAAFDAYKKLAESAGKPEMRAEATVKAAALAAELGHEDQAKQMFDRALSSPAIGDWSGVARLGVLRLAYEAGRYKEVLEAAEKGLGDLPKDAVPEGLLIEANARRQLGQTARALELYDQILREHGESEAAAQARFQRLVCLEATGAGDLAKQLDDFLAVSTNPREKAQATLLKAEMLFKAGNYAEAAPLYAAVLKSSLPERLRSPARYKLGWCQLQLGKANDAAATFTLFIDQNPKNSLLPAALIQRAMALQQSELYDAALKDFDRVLRDYPKAKEREIALQQKALIFGQQKKYDEMAKTFEELLAAYPQSKAAAQAEYWIGWQAFEKKDYPAAVARLKKARELDPQSFADRATLRIVLAAYEARDRDAVAAEVSKAKSDSLPADVLVWLGTQFYEDKDYKKAEEFLGPVAARGVGSTNPDALLALARARLAQKKFEPARDPIQQYLAAARDPLSRAKGLLASAEVSLGTGNYEDANKLVEEAMLLQPEGRYNGEARLLSGEVLMQRSDYAGAARAFATVAVLYDDPELTPRALTRAADAYRRAGNPVEAEKALAERASRYPTAETDKEEGTKKKRKGGGA